MPIARSPYREVAEKVGLVRQIRLANQRHDDATPLLLHEPFEDPAGRHFFVEWPEFIGKDVNALDAEPPANQIVVEAQALPARHVVPVVVRANPGNGIVGLHAHRFQNALIRDPPSLCGIEDNLTFGQRRHFLPDCFESRATEVVKQQIAVPYDMVIDSAILTYSLKKPGSVANAKGTGNVARTSFHPRRSFFCS